MRLSARFPVPFPPLVVAVLAFVASLFAVSNVAQAQTTLVQQPFAYGGYSGSGDSFVGQSLTTPISGYLTNGYNSIVFNFYSNGFGVATDPAAPGTLFVLAQEYTGTPSALSSSTPGYVTSVVGSGGLYTFDSSVVLASNTRYYFYAGIGNSYVASEDFDFYSGGNPYFAKNSSTPFTSGTFDIAFRLQGSAIPAPEPGTLPLLSMGLVTGTSMAGTARRRKRAC